MIVSLRVIALPSIVLLRSVVLLLTIAPVVIALLYLAWDRA